MAEGPGGEQEESASSARETSHQFFIGSVTITDQAFREEDDGLELETSERVGVLVDGSRRSSRTEIVHDGVAIGCRHPDAHPEGGLVVSFLV